MSFRRTRSAALVFSTKRPRGGRSATGGVRRLSPSGAAHVVSRSTVVRTRVHSRPPKREPFPKSVAASQSWSASRRRLRRSIPPQRSRPWKTPTRRDRHRRRWAGSGYEPSCACAAGRRPRSPLGRLVARDAASNRSLRRSVSAVIREERTNSGGRSGLQFSRQLSSHEPDRLGSSWRPCRLRHSGVISFVGRAIFC